MIKCALVTGGSRGIGRAVCLVLAEMGYYILINYKKNKDAATQTLKMIKKEGGRGELLQFDVSCKQEVDEKINYFLDTKKDRFIEVLINNAGIRKDKLLLWMKSDDWNEVINTNLNSFFYVTRLLLKNMILNRYGRVINIVSLSGLKGLAGQTNYSAAKGGVIAATKALAQEVGRKNVTVNAVAPGFISSDMTEDLPEKELIKLIPLRRFGKPEEVADLVGFLASKKASYINGEVISINGGLF